MVSLQTHLFSVLFLVGFAGGPPRAQTALTSLNERVRYRLSYHVVTFKKVLNSTMRLRRKRVKMVQIYQEMRSMQKFQPFTGTLGWRRRSNKIRSGKAFAVKTYYVGKQ